MDYDKSDKLLNLSKDLYSLRVKSIINALKKMNFEKFLKEHFEICGATPCSIFQNVIIDTIMAVEYAYKKNKELIDLVDILIFELGKYEKDEDDGEKISLDKSFARLIRKAIRLGEGNIPMGGIFNTFEFKYLFSLFKEIVASIEKQKPNEFYKPSNHYN